VEIVINGSDEIFLVGSVVEGNDISKFNSDVEAILLGETVELVLEIFSIRDILLEAENSPFLETDWLMDDCSKNACVVQRFTCTLGERIND